MPDSKDPLALFQSPEFGPPRQITLYKPEELPPGTNREIVDVVASDGAGSWGYLHEPPGGSDVCAIMMHPRGNQARHYIFPWLLHAGISAFGATSRYLGNDSNTTHEECVLDIGAGVRMLRDRGYKKIVLIGNSGGGSLLAHYQAQACKAPADRQAESPAGEPTGFAQEDMPPADLFITLAAHQGEGRILLGLLDPAVINEEDPVENDPELDMFNAANGYRPWPEQSSYDPEWLARYRAAQIERCRHLDTIARSRLTAYREAREAALKANDPSTAISRMAVTTRYMVIYRTIANPAHLDLSITPNRRPMGTIFGGGHPMKANYGPGNLSRVMTPRAWLSTWSGLSSAAELTDTIRDITQPTLIIGADADTDIYPHEQDELLELSGASDKSLFTVEWAGHYLTVAPGAPANVPHPRKQAGEKIAAWIKERS